MSDIIKAVLGFWALIIVCAAIGWLTGCAQQQAKPEAKPDPAQGAFIQFMELRDHD